MSSQEHTNPMANRRDRIGAAESYPKADATLVDVEYELREETLLEHIGRAARENPLSAALVGAGFIWMALGGARNLAQGEAGPTTSQATSAAVRAADRPANSMRGTAATAAESAQKAAAQTGGTVTRTAQRAADAAGETGAKIADVMRREASRSEVYAESALKRTGSAFSEVGQQIVNNLRGGAVAVEQGSDRARRAASDLAQTQPLLLSILCLGVGAGAAVLLPRTRAENELLGAYREKAVRTARTRAADLVARGVNVARAKASDAVHEAASKAADEAAERVLQQTDGIGEAVIDTLGKTVANEADAGSGANLPREERK